jgi:drug/metabolite transporter (DMT)-like permease
VLHRFWNSFYALIGATMLIWGATAAVVTHLFKQDLTAEEVTLIDILFAFVSLAVITLAVPGRRASLRRYRPRHLPMLLLLSMLGILAYNYLLYKAYSSDVGDVTPYAIINYMWPLTTIIFGVIILRERPTVYTWIAGVVGFLGFALIQLAKALENPAARDAWSDGGLWPMAREIVATTFGDASAAGCLLALAGAIIWGIFGPLARRWAGRHQADPLSSMMLYCGIAGVVALALFGSQVRWAHIFSRWDLVLPLAWLGVMAHGMANVLWIRTIEIGGAGRTGVVAYLTPVLALVFLWWCHGQAPSVASALGLGLILAAVAIAESHRKRSASNGLVK